MNLSLTSYHYQDMLAALQWAVSHPRVRVIVQSGEGKFFTAGKFQVAEQRSRFLPPAVESLTHFSLYRSRFT